VSSIKYFVFCEIFGDVHSSVAKIAIGVFFQRNSKRELRIALGNAEVAGHLSINEANCFTDKNSYFNSLKNISLKNLRLQSVVVFL
jgi:hypothetical protein